MGHLFSYAGGAKTHSTEAEKLDWLRLARTENVGPITFYRLVEFYGSPAEALRALPELAKRGGRKKPLIAPDKAEIERELTALQKRGATLITAQCEAYPLALSAIDDAPPILSALGDIGLLERPALAMVGARNASLNGKKFAAKLARELGAQGQIIVSGLARGIDTAAHEGALSSGTIAVVAGGIDVIYPEENTALYHKIASEGGLILAESPYGQKPFAQSFPRRNRIVSGLSSGVIVVEATMRSGSLITARMAGEQGRDVFAVPGHPLDPRADGPNHLIREGAALVRNAGDILEALRDFSGNTLREPYSPSTPLTPPKLDTPPVDNYEEPPENSHEQVLQTLSFTPIAVDEVLRNCHVSIGILQSILLDLELAGRIKRLPGNRISLVSE
ncbi:MAG: DNA-processing protein DprA [Alphaproteobacteria bacterium]